MCDSNRTLEHQKPPEPRQVVVSEEADRTTLHEALRVALLGCQRVKKGPERRVVK